MKRNGVNRIRFVAALLFAASVLGPAGDAHADFTFGEATNLGSAVNTSVEDGGPCISSDGLSLYFYSFYTGYATSAMRVATRATTEIGRAHV